MELTAAGRPFLTFPLRDHFEQNRHVAHRLDRHGAGRRMDYHRDGPAEIAAAIAEEIGRAPRYRPVEPHGAARAAEAISERLARRPQRDQLPRGGVRLYEPSVCGACESARRGPVRGQPVSRRPACGHDRGPRGHDGDMREPLTDEESGSDGTRTRGLRRDRPAL